MADTRRKFLKNVGASLACAPTSFELIVSTMWRGQKVVQIGSKLLVPVGLAGQATRASAEPVTAILLIMAALGVGGFMSSRARNAVGPTNTDAWMPRIAGSSDDFHDRTGDQLVLKPEYRGVHSFPNDVKVNTARDGRTWVESPINAGEFRKDLSDGDAQAIWRNLHPDDPTVQNNPAYAIFPKSERVMPAVTATGDAAKLMREAWKIMFGEESGQVSLRNYVDKHNVPYMLVRNHTSGRSSLLKEVS